MSKIKGLSSSYDALEKQYFEYFGVSTVSFSAAVFAAETRVQNIYDEATQRGTLPFNCTKVHFVGQPRVGKTSTMKRLLGKYINVNEQPTDGIDKKSAEVNCGQNYWRENKNSGWADYNESLAFCAAQVIKETVKKSANTTPLKDGGVDYTQTRPTNSERQPETANLTQSFSRFLINTVNMLIICFLCLFLRTLFVLLKTEIGLWGFPTIYLSFMIRFGLSSLWGFKNHLENPITICKAYRTLSALAFFSFMELSVQEVHIDLATRVSMLFGNNFIFLKNVVHCMSVATFVFCLFFVQSSGSRTGFLLALCYAFGPDPDQNDNNEKYESWISAVYSKDVKFCIFESILTYLCIAVAFAFCLHLKWIKDRLGNMLTFFLSAMVIAVFSITSSYLSIFFTIFCGFENGVGFFNGLFMGRVFERKAGLHYFIRKGMGFATGLFFVKFVFGWEFYRPGVTPYNWALRHLTLLIILTGELVRYMFVKRSGIPGRETRFALQNVEMSNKPPSRLILMDYAGDAIWLPTHHIFMSNHSVYLLVFSLIEFQNNIMTRRQEDYFNSTFLLWLHSITSHTEKQKDFRILIVGTHRANMSDKEVNTINDWLCNKFENCSYRKHIYTKPDGNLVFALENLESFDNDPDFFELRKSIWYITQENTMYTTNEYPIKWRKLSKVIEKYREKEKFIVSFAHFRREAEILGVISRDESDESKNEFRKILKFFSKSGYILYENDYVSDQNGLEEESGSRLNEKLESEKYIVVDPSYLINVLKLLEKNEDRPKRKFSTFKDVILDFFRLHSLNFNRLNKINFKDGPQPLGDKNISGSLIYESALSKLLGENSSLVINLLKRYDLLCATGKKKKLDLPDGKENTYIIPSRLTPLTPEEAKVRLETYQSVFHFVFLPHGLAPVIFRRLLVHCVNMLDFTAPVSPEKQFKIHKNAGFFKRFNQKPLKYSINELCVKYEQENSIEVCLENASWDATYELIKEINSHLRIISDRDFSKVNYYVEFIVNERESSENVSFKRIYNRDEARQGFPSDDIFLNKCGVKKDLPYDEPDSPVRQYYKSPTENTSVLRANWKKLKEEMDIDQITPHLYQDQVLSLQEMKNFQDAKEAGRPRSDRSNRTLMIVTEKGDQALTSLTKALQAIGQKHFAELLSKKHY